MKNGEVSEKLPPPPPVPKNASPEEKTKYNKVIEKYKANQKELDLRKRELIEQEKKVIEGNLAVKEQQIKIEEIKNIPPPPPVPVYDKNVEFVPFVLIPPPVPTVTAPSANESSNELKILM
mgnify:CR=1 FL=1